MLILIITLNDFFLCNKTRLDFFDQSMLALRIPGNQVPLKVNVQPTVTYHNAPMKHLEKRRKV